MFLFWFFVVVLTLIGLAFVLKPLLFYKHAIEKFNSENLDSSQPAITATVLLLVLPLMSILLYLHWGNSHVVTQWLANKKNSDAVKQEIAKFGSREKIIIALREKLQQLPADENSAKGWYLLGKLYFNEKMIKESIESFEKAVKLKPNQADYMLDYVSAKFYFYQRLSLGDKKLLNKILSLSPGNINAVNLLALDAYQQGNYPEAIRYWESLLQYFQPESEDSKNLLQMIHQAQNQRPQSAKMNAVRKIQVRVDVIPDVKNKIKANTTLFVYALEAGGSKIPLAALRLNANQMPCDVILDSTQSMIPGRSLDSADKIYIQARISKTGNAMTSKGDYVGTSGVIDLTTHNKKIDINISKIVD